MKYILCLFILISCGSSKPLPKPPVIVPPPSEPVKIDTIHKTVTDTIYNHIVIHDTVKTFVSFKDFGAAGDGRHDDADAIQAAVDYVIKHPQPLIVEIGNFYISHPIHLQNNGRYFTIHIAGILPNKSSSDEYLSKITYGGRSGYAFGIQFGRSVEIENITVLGQYTFPYSVNNYNIGTLKFADWVVPGFTDDRYHPYAAIVIDPDTNVSGTRGGTSDVTIKNCSIKQWMVGICLSPNGVTQNDEMINILEDNIEAVRICVSIGQDQSKTVNIKGLKVWNSVYTVVDGLSYGRGTGGGSLFCENWNIAGNCKELFNISTSRFPLSCKDIYSESLFRIGNVGSGTGSNFINTEIDFLSGPGMPDADYLIQGQVNFYGGCFRYYDGDPGHRLNFATTGFVRYGIMFRDMTISNLPITQGLYGIPTNTWASCRFDNVLDFFTGFDIGNKKDTLIPVYMSGLSIDRSNWTGTATISGINPVVNDYLIAEPTANTANYYDGYGVCTTKNLGRVEKVAGNIVYLDHIGINALSGIDYGRVYISRIK